ncbi:MAG: sigma-70 family RNA polymerase sigma factor [Paramuribaculum sp.]|nr:sigma-70 family RNA polymerase sigma factor [Paramuribaculum sp.]
MADDNQIPRSERELNRFFERERKRNVVYLQGRYHLSYEDAEDIYQDSCLALFKNIQDGKLVSLTAKLSTYFTQICIFQTLKKIRDEKQIDSLDNGQYDSDKVDELLGLDGGVTIAQQLKMEEIINNLPEPCDKILWAYYYDNLSMSEIAPLIGYNGADSVKSKKSQCMGKLKKRFDQQTKEDYYDGEE